MDQSQKSLRQPKIPDFLAAKQPKIMNLRLFITNWIWQLMYHCKYINKFVLLLRKSAVGS